MRVSDILAKKRDGHQLSDEEIIFFVESVTNQKASMEQIGAFLMAVYIQGMTEREKISLTKSMMYSGTVLDWQAVLPEHQHNLVVDKHSTGGVGDKMSIPLAPALVACGLKVPMIAGRGLGHTGGTIDKLESIPGYIAALNPDEIQTIVARDHCCIASQSSEMIPADRTLYAVRDVTSTVSSLPLITGSIVSKKAAEGLSSLILDIKVGKAAFMKNIDDATALAQSMIETAEGLGIQTRAMLSWMENPIGNMIGNSLEIQESIEILKGGGPEDSIFITTQLGAHLLEMTGMVQSLEEGEAKIRRAFKDGSALQHFKTMLKNHRVHSDTIEKLCDDPISVLPQAKYKTPIYPKQDGYIKSIDGMGIAQLGLSLKAGREHVEDIIDPAVGIELCTLAGEYIQKNEPWAIIHHNEDLHPNWIEKSKSFLSFEETSKPRIPSRIITVLRK